MRAARGDLRHRNDSSMSFCLSKPIREKALGYLRWYGSGSLLLLPHFWEKGRDFGASQKEILLGRGRSFLARTKSVWPTDSCLEKGGAGWISDVLWTRYSPLSYIRSNHIQVILSYCLKKKSEALYKLCVIQTILGVVMSCLEAELGGYSLNRFFFF